VRNTLKYKAEYAIGELLAADSIEEVMAGLEITGECAHPTKCLVANYLQLKVPAGENQLWSVAGRFAFLEELDPETRTRDTVMVVDLPDEVQEFIHDFDSHSYRYLESA
jgi:hypothetical protein